MSINLFTNERITYLLERVHANAILLPRVEHAWSEADRSPNMLPEENAQIRAAFREEWRDLMQRYDWLAQHYDADQMTPAQRSRFEELAQLIEELRPVMERLDLPHPEAPPR